MAALNGVCSACGGILGDLSSNNPEKLVIETVISDIGSDCLSQNLDNLSPARERVKRPYDQENTPPSKSHVRSLFVEPKNSRISLLEQVKGLKSVKAPTIERHEINPLDGKPFRIRDAYELECSQARKRALEQNPKVSHLLDQLDHLRLFPLLDSQNPASTKSEETLKAQKIESIVKDLKALGFYLPAEDVMIPVDISDAFSKGNPLNVRILSVSEVIADSDITPLTMFKNLEELNIDFELDQADSEEIFKINRLLLFIDSLPSLKRLNFTLMCNQRVVKGLDLGVLKNLEGNYTAKFYKRDLL